ncbi:hypothetical protein EVAR_38469_1 [Eumeta japonica]|uniref:Uncharacterized protein n=1 Tax=Eumeta variegata TaxID=151549 RepID=A0A4C1WMT4_EUMVA|nr:hypothetical protein EVAR_38469_1 [Eumeta japonica]
MTTYSLVPSQVCLPLEKAPNKKLKRPPERGDFLRRVIPSAGFARLERLARDLNEGMEVEPSRTGIDLNDERAVAGIMMRFQKIQKKNAAAERLKSKAFENYRRSFRTDLQFDDRQ